MQNTRSNSMRPARRGFTVAEAAAVAAALAVAASVAVPVFRRVGCSAMRQQSMAQLATLASAHAEYAADFNGRQYTACPDNIAQFGSTASSAFYAYQIANGCIPPLILGTASNGAEWGYYLGCGGSGGGSGNAPYYLPISSPSSDSMFLGLARLTNTRRFNTYVNGRFYDQTFYAPDDPAMRRKVQRWINEGRDFEYDNVNYVQTTYDYSPAAMVHPRVFGDGTSLSNPSYLDPHLVPNGEGYKSPSNAQCLHPSLKTRLLERHCMEPSLGPNPWIAGGQTPYQWNQSYRARSYAAFFDGSVRMFTTAEAMDSENRSRVPGTNQIARLWVRNTPEGYQGYNGNDADDSLVSTSVHYFTAGGIRGRDTLPPP